MEKAYHIEIFVSSILIKKIIKLVKMEWGHPLLVREIDNLQRQLVFPKGYLSWIALTALEREQAVRFAGSEQQNKNFSQGELGIISDHFFGKK